MSTYNETNIQSSTEFLDFIKSEYGFDSYDDIPFWDKSALMYRFKALNNDMDPEETALVTDGGNETYYEALTETYYPGQKFEELSDADKLFVQAVSAEVVKPEDMDLIREYAEKNQFVFGQNQDEVTNENVEEQTLDNVVEGNSVAEEEAPSGETVIGQENEEELENVNTNLRQVEINGETYMVEPLINEGDVRELSLNSDDNEFLMDKLKLRALLEIEVINEDLYNAGIKNPQSAIEKLSEVRPLNEEETAQFDEKMVEYTLADINAFKLTPPSILADQYEKIQQQKVDKLAQDEKADVSKEDEKIVALQDRMLELSIDFYNEQNLFFADAFNTGDTHDGYVKMTDALDKWYVEPMEEGEEKDSLKEVLETNRETLQVQIDDYDAGWNLENATPERAEEIEKRLNDVNSMLDNVVIDEETLALVSKFKFITNGEEEKPFIDKNGEKSSTYTEGAKIDPESKLATVVRIAKQNAMQSTIADNTEITQESLNKEVSDQLGAALYTFNVGDQIANHVLEDPKAFTDEDKRKEFLDNLRNAEEPTYLSENGFEAGLDATINMSAAYASRLNKKLGKDNPTSDKVATSILEPLKDLDKRAGDRTTDVKPSKRKARIAMAKRALKGAVSAFLVSGAITVAATATATDASLTAATMGMNKLAGAAIGTGLAVVAAAASIRKWRKQRKAEGKPRGLMSMIKDPRLATTLATTALGGAALGFAATGNPGVAMACGSAALAVGAGSNAIYTAKDAHKMGLSKAEAIGWGVVNAAATVAAGFGGRAAANWGIDVYNQHNPDNDLFQHKEKIGSHTEDYTEKGTRMVIDYGALNENAQDFLQDNWYKDHPELLQSRIEALTTAGVENPHHALLIAHDAGLRAPDNMLMWDGSTSNGNHTVLTHAWAEQNGVSTESVDAFKHLFNNDGSVNTDAIAAYKEMAPHVGEDNFVSRIEDRPVIRELYGDRESTYDNDHKLPMKEEQYDIPKQKEVDDYGMVKNDNKGAGLGMVGVLATPFRAAKKLKERVGSLLDRIVKPKKELPPAPIKQEVVVPPVIKEEKEQPKEDPNKKLLIDEYKIVHGIEPSDKELNRYLKLVEKEQEKDPEAPKDMHAYLEKRKENFDKTLDSVIMVHRKEYDKELAKIDQMEGSCQNYDANNAKRKLFINNTRQTMWQSNLGEERASDVTLLDFEKIMTYETSNSNDRTVITKSRDAAKTPNRKGKSNPIDPMNLKDFIRSNTK